MTNERRAAAFWGSPTMALLLEAPPKDALSEQFRDLLLYRPAPDVVTAFGMMPDYRSVRRELGLRYEQAAKLLHVEAMWVFGLEQGWRMLSLESFARLASGYGVPMGAFFHDAQFEMRPITRAYGLFLKSDGEQIVL